MSSPTARDKLLGGPQAGMLTGTAALIERMRKNSCSVHCVVDKLTYAALEATLLAYVKGATMMRFPHCE